LEYRSRLDGVGDVEEARWSRRLTKGSGSHIATTRQLEGAGHISGPGGFGERQRMSTGVNKTEGQRFSLARGKMESEPRHWVTVAHGDLKTLGGRRTTFLTRRLWKASLVVHWSTEDGWMALET
jgi:hypothetical protein